MKYKRIKNLHVLGRNFKVIHKKLDAVDGLCCPNKEKITIALNAPNKPRAMYHEMFHAIIFSGGLYDALNANTQLIEVICEQFARVVDENFEFAPRN